MHILLLTQYFPPETGAAQQRLSDLVKRLTYMEHKVTVLTSMPNYPQGKVFEQYRGRILCEEEENNIRILRTWSYVSKSRGFLSRLLNYCSFALIALCIGIIKGGEQDIVLTESPPLFLGITGVLLSRWCGASLILNVSDLWPQSAVSMGMLHNQLLIRMSGALELFIYRKCLAITGQTEGIVQSISDRTSKIPVKLITNGVDPERFENCGNYRERIRDEFGFENYFVLGFTGLHGLAYDFDCLFRVAESMQNSNPHILFAFFGDGPMKQHYCELAERKKIANVRFFPPQPGNNMPAVFSSLDAAIIPLKNSMFYAGTLPSRLFDCMAAGLPTVLAIVEGEATRLLTKANGGICVPPEDVNAIADAIRRFANDPELCRALGQNARDYIFAHYDRRELARRFVQLLPKDDKIDFVNKSSGNHKGLSPTETKVKTAVAD
jgi:glycosyltransferase involved in cell wall biosynthesis